MALRWRERRPSRRERLADPSEPARSGARLPAPGTNAVPSSRDVSLHLPQNPTAAPRAAPAWVPRLRAMKSPLLLVGALTLPALVMATQLYAGYRLQGFRVEFGAALLVQLCHWQLWALFGPLVWHLAQRWPVEPRGRRRALVRHVAAAPAVALAVLALYWAAYHVLVRLPPTAGWFVGFDRSLSSTAVFFLATYFHVELLIYGGIVAAAQTFRTTAQLRAREHEALRLESELTSARLAALRLQLQPHFLFNALHTIGSLVLQGQQGRAVGLLAELGDLLRATLAHRDTELTPLRTEVAHLERYLRIEEARFGDRLAIRWRLQDAALDALVPPFILQPIIENAFRHGIAPRTDVSLLSIEATVEHDALRVTVCNDGPPLPEAFRLEEAQGFGLKNVAQRLRARTPPGHVDLATATCSDAETPGVRATLVFPLWDGATEKRSH